VSFLDADTGFVESLLVDGGDGVRGLPFDGSVRLVRERGVSAA